MTIPSEKNQVMNVRGFNSEGDVTELQVAAQNESLVALSTRFTKAMSEFPSFETENALIEIVEEIQGVEYAKIVKFQCEREIAKCKIQRKCYSEAIPYLIESLKTDSTRADVWVQLAICAKNTHNANLFRAANSKIRQLRPQMEIEVQAPELPNLIIPDEKPKFIGYQLPTPCWRQFLRLLDEAVHITPYQILEISYSQPQLIFQQSTYDLGRPSNIRHQPLSNISKQQIVKTLGGVSLIDFFQKIIVQQVNSHTWIFSEPVISLCATTLNKIAQLPFKTERVHKDIALSLIDLALNYVFNDLTPQTKLFLAELAAECKPSSCGTFLRDIDSANLHPQNALLRISFATLQESLRKNLNYNIIESQLEACRLNLDQELCLAHAGITINKELLDEKERQIAILKMISTHMQSNEQAVELFDDPQKLSFLSLTNIIKLFMQFDAASMNQVFPKFLLLLPDLIDDNPKELDGLAQIFNKIVEPFEKDSITNLLNAFRNLNEDGADKNLIFSCALAIARCSVNYEDRAATLIKVHKQLGKYNVCSNNSGKFLEYLMDALIERADQYESDLTSAFTCYFSDVPLCNVNHHSTLKFRCSRYIRPFIEHVYKLDSKGNIQPFLLFAPYLAIWKHSKQDCNCIDSIDGWRMYRVIKKKESQLSKSELPDKYTPQGVLEDLLRHDPENRTESRIALGKVLIRSFVTSSEPRPNIFYEDNEDNNEQEKKLRNLLSEAIELLNSGDNSPPLMLYNAIAHALINDNPQQTLKILLDLPVFEKPKKEARRLYWTIRLLLETGDKSKKAQELAALVPKLKSDLPPDFAMYLQCIAADAFHEKKLYHDLNNAYCKARIQCPYPSIRLAQMAQPNEAFSIISKLVRPQSVNIVSFFHFDFKPPFLMAKPNDITQIRRDIIELFVKNAADSGNFQSLFVFINPSMKLDGKVSKVLKSSGRIIYGVDRMKIFALYVRELTKMVIAKGDRITNEKDKDKPQERAIDVLMRASHIDLTDELNEALEELFNYLWKKYTGTEPTAEASTNQLINIMSGRSDEEEDEEEDGDFVDKSSDDDDDGAPKPKARNENDFEEEAVEGDEDDEADDVEDDDAEEDDVEEEAEETEEN